MILKIDLHQLVSLASGIKGSENNPSYDETTFYSFYPQFENRVPSQVVAYYIALANNCLSYDMYGEQWKLVMGLYIAHFLTLYLQTSDIAADAPNSAVIKASMAYGLAQSKSAGSLSISYDYGSVNDDLNGWAAWKLTIFGQQFASIAKLVGKSGSYIW